MVQQQEESVSPTQEDTRHSVDMAMANLLGIPVALLTVLPLVT
ncbi:MAG: hypothetical protein ACKOS8_00685 [Gemmataceae bacterium]